MASYDTYNTKKGVRWKFIIENGIDPRTGKRDRIVRGGFMKRKDAKAAAEPLEYKLGLSNVNLKQKIGFSDFTDEWIEDYAQRDVKPSSIRIRKKQVKKLDKYFGDRPIREITSDMYQKCLFYLKNNEKLKYNTLSGIHSAARMIFERAVNQHLIFSNPTDGAHIPKGVKTVDELENEKIEDKYYEKKELDQFLNAVRNHGKLEDYPIFLTLSWTGMRIGELASLKWKDIDFEEYTISITKTYYNPNGMTKDFQLLTPKTTGSIRIISVEKEVIQALKVHRLRQNKIKLMIGKDYFDEDYVFGRSYPPYFGYPMDPHTIESRMESIINKYTKLKKRLTPHGLRHTHISLLAEAGVDLERIMSRVGHVDDDTTKKIYLHVTKPRKKGASHMFGEHMRST